MTDANHAYPRGFELIFWLWFAVMLFPNHTNAIAQWSIRILGKRHIEQAFRDFAASLPAVSEV